MKSTGYFFASAVLVMLIASCSKDEVVPPVPVDGLTAFSGRNRAKVEFNAPDDAVSGKVFFNNGDYKEFDITGSAQAVIIEGLAEQEHVLRVVTLNADGAVSDPKAVKVNVYGDNYENTLKPRKWKDRIMRSSSSVELVFEPAFSNETIVRVVYFTTAGSKDSVDMPANENTVVLENIDTEDDYWYYSVYKPEPTSIDNFSSASLGIKTAVMMDFQKEKWTIAGSSGAEAENGAINIIDDDSGTSWRTQLGGTFPHWSSVDMGTPKVIDGFYYVKMPDGGNDAPKELKIEVSLDNVDWMTVLETEVKATFLRQQLALEESVTARYFRITVSSPIDPGASQVSITEIDTYNILNQSGANGYVQVGQVELVNATAPFTGDGSNLLAAVGAGRMQQVAGWTHNKDNIISYDNNTQAMNLFCAPVWGGPPVTNGKIYQTITLQPGDYLFKIQTGSAQGPIELVGIAAKGESLPDYTDVTTSPATIQYANLMDHQDKTAELFLTITEEKPTSLGVVYNLHDQYGATGIPWTQIGFKGFELLKVE